MKLSDLQAAPYNPRKIEQKALDGLAYSLEEFGDLSGITYNSRTGRLVAGHQRVKALKQKFGDLFIENGTVTADGKTFAVRFVDWDEAKEKAANVAANAPTISGEFTAELQPLLDEIKLESPEAYERLSFENLDIQVEPEGEAGESKKGNLSDRFLIPPFSVLDARQGYWQQRKRAWLALGIQSELGRGGANIRGLPTSDGAGAELLQETLGAIPSNERSIMNRTGKYAVR